MILAIPVAMSIKALMTSAIMFWISNIHLIIQWTFSTFKYMRHPNEITTPIIPQSAKSWKPLRSCRKERPLVSLVDEVVDWLDGGENSWPFPKYFFSLVGFCIWESQWYPLIRRKSRKSLVWLPLLFLRHFLDILEIVKLLLVGLRLEEKGESVYLLLWDTFGIFFFTFIISDASLFLCT